MTSGAARADALLLAAGHLPVRDLRRLGHILHVMAEKGWGHYVERLRLKGYLPKGRVEPTAESLSDAQRFRLALEELGTTLIKFGQMLSIRRDLLPDEVIQELQKLQDAVPPFPAEQARRTVEDELGRPVDQLFADFDDTPLAAASIAQVHTARLADGTSVIVKVQRPDIESLIQADLEILFFIARLLHKHVPEMERYDPVGLVEEFSETITRELDFRREGRNAERFRENFQDEPSVVAPRVFWEASGRRVLTMERSMGHKIGADYPPDSEQRRHLAGTLVHVYLTQLFEHGFFHGDPHPGNLFVMNDGRLCFHDFGIVGRLGTRDQENLKQLFLALMLRDAEWMADVYLDLGGGGADVDRDAFARDLSESLEEYYAVAAEESSFTEVLYQFVRLGRRHRIRVIREFLLVVKALITMESVVRTLQPRFDMPAALQAYVPRMIGRQLFPGLSLSKADLLGKGYRAYSALRLATAGLPRALSKAVRQLQRGEAVLRLRHEQLEGLEQHLDRASNRLSLSLIIASVVVGSSIVMSTDIGPHYGDIPLLGLFGYILATLLGLWWVIGILRSGRF
ncbi:MAG: ABC1 kinase family protein [Pseudomonadota bacterium]